MLKFSASGRKFRLNCRSFGLSSREFSHKARIHAKFRLWRNFSSNWPMKWQNFAFWRIYEIENFEIFNENFISKFLQNFAKGRNSGLTSAKMAQNSVLIFVQFRAKGAKLYKERLILVFPFRKIRNFDHLALGTKCALRRILRQK